MTDIVLVMVDQLAARWLERAAADAIVPLPGFARLRASGTTFRNAFTGNPVCSPARATIATGLTSQGHGVTECGYDLDPAVPTFMRALQESGTRTGAFGKLHFRTQLEGVNPDYRPYGYDVTEITEDPRAGAWLDWVRAAHPEHYEAAQATVWMTMVPELAAYGPEREDLAGRIERVRAEFGWATEEFPDNTSEAYTLPFPAEVSQTAWITDRALEFISGTPADRSLFAHVSYVQPHNPFAPPAEYAGLVDTARIPSPAPAEWYPERDPAYFRAEHYPSPSYDRTDWRHERRMYFADLAHLDHELGRILDGLAAAGRQDAYVIFTSDHGELLHDHGLTGKWERHYDPCVRVPFIVAGPGVAGGTVRDELVDHTDIAPTVYELAGLPLPRLSRPYYGRPLNPPEIPALPGRSVLPLCRGEAAEGWRDAVYVRSDNNHWEASPRSWARTVRTARYRYTRFLGGGGEQLFDLAADPDEQRNLAGDPAYDGPRRELADRLFELVAGEGYPNSPRALYGIGTW